MSSFKITKLTTYPQFNLILLLLPLASKVMLWAPAINLGGENPTSSWYYKLGAYIFGRYSAATPYISTVPTIRRLLGEICATEEAQETTCQSAYSRLYGPAYGQMKLVGIDSAETMIISFERHSSNSFNPSETWHTQGCNRCGLFT